jgi:hypothetical protein
MSSTGSRGDSTGSAPTPATSGWTRRLPKADTSSSPSTQLEALVAGSGAKARLMVGHEFYRVAMARIAPGHARRQKTEMNSVEADSFLLHAR